MKIHSLDSACLLVRDVERSRQFYTQVLEMEEIPRPSSFNFPGAWLKKGSAILHLIGEPESGRVDQIYPGSYNREELADGYGNHIAFEVEDLDEAVQDLKAHNIEIAGGPRPRGDGITQLYICDPDGYIIELCDGQK
jgi:catechol 2,3-dioxygenase-like lactoylglutathione lyase family enzyme